MRFVKMLLAATLAVVSTRVDATAQIPDTIVLDGEESPLHSEPLRPLLRVPEAERIIELEPAEDGCSASWRGYAASWSIRSDRLFLERIVTDPCGEHVEVPLERAFAGRKAPLHAFWFTGVLIVPRGRMIEYVHMGYDSTYERYVLLVLEKGRVVFRTDLDEPPER